MSDPTTPDLRRAPRPIPELAALLARRGTPLVEKQPLPRSGDRIFHATTPIGVVRVWVTRGFWASDVALPGVAGFVDALVWESCRGGKPVSRLTMPAPPVSAAFVTGLIEAPSLPDYDADCLTQAAAQRAEGAKLPKGRLLVGLVVAHLALMVMALIGGNVFDLMVLRLMAGLTFVSLATLLVRVLVERRREGRRDSREPAA